MMKRIKPFLAELPTLLVSSVIKVLWLDILEESLWPQGEGQANVENWLVSYPYNTFGQQARLPDRLLQFHVQTFVFFFPHSKVELALPVLHLSCAVDFTAIKSAVITFIDSQNSLQFWPTLVIFFPLIMLISKSQSLCRLPCPDHRKECHYGYIQKHFLDRPRCNVIFLLIMGSGGNSCSQTLLSFRFHSLEHKHLREVIQGGQPGNSAFCQYFCPFTTVVINVNTYRACVPLWVYFTTEEVFHFLNKTFQVSIMLGCQKYGSP